MFAEPEEEEAVVVVVVVEFSFVFVPVLSVAVGAADAFVVSADLFVSLPGIVAGVVVSADTISVPSGGTGVEAGDRSAGGFKSAAGGSSVSRGVGSGVFFGAGGVSSSPPLWTVPEGTDRLTGQ